jgi:hypothetical protein
MRSSGENESSCNFINKLLREMYKYASCKQWRTQEFCLGRGGVQEIQLWTEGRENRDLGAVAP